MMDDEARTDASLLDRSKRDFTAAVDATDAQIAARLRTARTRALEQAGSRRWPMPASVWVPAAVAAGLAAIVLVPRIDSLGTDAARDLDAVVAADLDLLLAEEALEMLAELEFYEWLDVQQAPQRDGETEDGVG